MSSDGVIRGYTNNCSFYISGSSDLLQKINYKKIDYKNKNLYENKDNKKINDKTYIDSTQKNENKNNYNRYINYSNNISKKDNNINNTINLYTNTLEKNYGQSRYNIPISLKKRNEQKNIINYTQTEPSNNVFYYSQNTSYNYNYNKDKNENNKDNNNIIPNQRRIYKTSTNINLNENNRTNYFKTETEQKLNINRRNNTPNTLRLEDKYLSTQDNKKNEYNKLNKNKERVKHTINEIPHNFNKQKYHYNVDISSYSNRNLQPQSKHTLSKVNSNSNLNSKYNKYNIYQTQPRQRQYGTRTETHNYSNRNYSSSILNKTEKDNIKLYEIPKYSSNDKKTNIKKYETHSVNYSLPKYNIRNYSVNTDTSAMNKTNNYLRNNEYEVNDIYEYRKKQKLKNNNEYNNNINKNNNIKKIEYTPFQKGLINIRDNKKEIEKEEINEINLRQKTKNHHSIYISNNLSQNKNKKYKTSTQNFDNQRRNKYTLSNLNE